MLVEMNAKSMMDWRGRSRSKVGSCLGLGVWGRLIDRAVSSSRKVDFLPSPLSITSPRLPVAANMPKSARNSTGNGVSKSDPYAGSAARKKGHSVNNVFKFNTDLGQHILKNPGVAQAIVDKADLKQSDVRLSRT